MEMNIGMPINICKRILSEHRKSGHFFGFEYITGYICSNPNRHPLYIFMYRKLRLLYERKEEKRLYFSKKKCIQAH